MFDFVRRNTKFFAAPLFLLIIVAFVMVGVDGYKGFITKGASVATVDGKSITQEEWDQAHKNEVDRIRASGVNVDPKLLESEKAKQATLDQLIQAKLVQAYIQRNHLATTDARLAGELQKIPVIASLKKADGTLDYDKYKQLLAAQGLTPTAFEAQFRNELTGRQVFAALAASDFLVKSNAQLAWQAYGQQREVELQYFDPKDYLSKVSVTDAEAKAYFDAHNENFKSEEKVDVEYLLLSADAIAKQVVISDAELKDYYEKNASQLASKEERRASHILIAADKDLPSAEREKVKAKALGILNQVKSNTSSFAKLAKQYSDDPGSASKGGDLDFFARGAMVKSFEDAVFSMEKGKISDLIATDYGFHIIQLTDIKKPSVPSLESMRAKLEKELRSALAQKKFAEMAEILASSVYEEPDSYVGAAKKLAINPVRVSGLVNLAGSTQDAVAGNQKVRDWIFGNAATVKTNSEPIDLSPTQIVSVRVLAHSPSVPLDYSQAKSEVYKLLANQKASVLARDAANAKAIFLGQKDDRIGSTVTVSRASKDLPEVVKDAVMRVSTAKLPAIQKVDLPQGGGAVVVVRKILEAPSNAGGSNRVAQARLAAEGDAFYQSLKTEFKVSTKK
ncbi:SurA N-terminal domain-containing protein [Curvibacter sp. CHRR-16]|uniref:SurA N-terminal domain-containing protein n=1 Tax=Curvibacter sp. CHRR-16 TaxID=2835872 RepID=UPI001BDAC7A6|nr:SurA N-terminal domain-containing protein [Curvibacter sp. CHRR-16]MBT0571112.1 SurA N-terminal domain-containing protein [Curvibacter sp. CHRR-16]